jgi:hypothetical protein
MEDLTMDPHDDDLKRELDAGDPATRLHEEFEALERELGAEAAAVAAQIVARLCDEFTPADLKQAALVQLRRLEDEQAGAHG